MIGESFNEAETLPQLIESKGGTGLFVAYVAKTILLYQFKDYEGAIANAALAAEQAGSAFGFMQVAVLNFYHSLALLAHYPQVNDTEKQQYLNTVNTNQENMKHWAYYAPVNYQHKYDLVEAEKARILKQTSSAMELYEISIQRARQQGYIQEGALANELAAEFYFSRGREKLAQFYLTEAYYTFIRWGATGKSQDLESRYSEFLSRLLLRETISIERTLTTTYTTVTGSAALDLAAIVKASIAISSKIVLEQFLEKLINILVETAGARKGIVLLKEANQ
ncbi:hypothetical protein [Coleofasciculus sp. FACHB-542]|uniref:hypothetical protein n=1 Tax=Coleofasciculus sp. FACHB-542 TaxID=2692787 RepID=UPI0032200D28